MVRRGRLNRRERNLVARCGNVTDRTRERAARLVCAFFA